MNGNTQFGSHPDAESLNAFAEQMLAGQEREQVAAHLAACRRCREIVFLAQEASVEYVPELVAAASAPVAEAASRKYWFRNWKLAWLPAAALAAGVSIAYIVHVRHEEPPGQLAQVEKHAPPVLPNSQAAPAAQRTRENEGQKPLQPKPKGNRSAEVAAAPPPIVNEPVGTEESVLQRTVADASELKSAPPVTQADKRQAPMQPGGLSEALTATAAAPIAGTSPTGAGRGTLQAAVAPAPMAKSARRESKVVVASTVFQSSQAGLPSGLRAISIAKLEKSILVVDEVGNVFLSGDGGVHWDSIGRQWNGKAVAVRTGPESKNAPAGSAGSQESGFELVNDQGQVWVSADGRTWKTKTP